MMHVNVYLLKFNVYSSGHAWEIVDGVPHNDYQITSDGTLPDHSDYRIHLGIFSYEDREAFLEELFDLDDRLDRETGEYTDDAAARRARHIQRMVAYSFPTN